MYPEISCPESPVPCHQRLWFWHRLGWYRCSRKRGSSKIIFSIILYRQKQVIDRKYERIVRQAIDEKFEIFPRQKFQYQHFQVDKIDWNGVELIFQIVMSCHFVPSSQKCFGHFLVNKFTWSQTGHFWLFGTSRKLYFLELPLHYQKLKTMEQQQSAYHRL